LSAPMYFRLTMLIATGTFRWGTPAGLLGTIA
jgi:hypothetical protein